jgi:undecaprenyl-diphosphatase
MGNGIDQLLVIDKSLFFAINGSWASPALDIVMVFVTLFGNGLFLAGIVAPLLYFGDRRHFKSRGPAILAAVLLGILVNNIIKEAVGRPRPLAEFSEEIRTGAVWVHTVFERWRGNSFPSGHSQTAFGTATAVAYYYRGWYTPLTFVLAAAVAVSRVYLGVHFPLDTATGALVGVACSLGMCVAWEKGKRFIARRKRDSQTLT